VNPQYPAFVEELAQLTRLKKVGFEPRVIYDVGANSGFWSEANATVFPDAEYHLFEPLHDHVDSCRRNMESVLARHPRFTLHKIALGVRTGSCSMYTHAEPGGNTSLPMAAHPDFREEPGIPMFTVADARRHFGLPAPQLLKIDIQGGELDVLKGYAEGLRSVPVLLLECWLTRGYGPHTPLLTEVAMWLQPFGFYLYDTGYTYRDTDGTLMALDTIFMNVRCPFSRNRDDLHRYR
jgi:FkbM family methyltransferase